MASSKISVVTVPTRLETKINTQEGIFNNGSDNLYPQLIENLINASVSARTTSDMLHNFIVGDGFMQEGLNEFVIYKDHMGEVTMYEMLDKIAADISKHKGAYAAVQWNANGKVAAIKHIPYRDCRLGKSDSNRYSGKIHVSPEWGKSSYLKKKSTRIVDVFNPIKEVVIEQMKDANWQGQISYLYLNNDYVYPLATIDTVQEDADTENQIAKFKNKELRRGFFAKYLIYHTDFADQQEEKDFKDQLNKGTGGDHEAAFILAPAEFDKDGKFIESSAFQLVKIDQNTNDKIFDSFELSTANNIRKAHYGQPKILTETSDGTLFAQNGEAFVQAFNFYNTQTKKVRMLLSQWLGRILKHHEDIEIANSSFTIKQLSYGDNTLDDGRASND